MQAVRGPTDAAVGPVRQRRANVGTRAAPAFGLAMSAGYYAAAHHAGSTVIRERPVRYWEDFQPGQVLHLGSSTVTEADVVGFARSWDPQPMHLDPDAAAATDFGGLIASGLHTLSVCMRLFVDGLLLDSAALASPGFDSVRWTAPVRPADTLTLTVVVDEVHPSGRRTDQGVVVFEWRAVNQDDVTVLTMRSRGRFSRRAALPALTRCD